MLKWLLAVITAGMLLTGALGTAAQTGGEGECPPSQFVEWGENGAVTPGDANNVRSAPSVNARRIGQIAPGEPFNVIYGSATCADGYLWIEISTAALDGWTVEISAAGGDPFVVPYVTEEREVSTLADDGSLHVEESGVSFTVPAELSAALGVTQVILEPRVGWFGDAMGAQPNSVTFTLLDDEDTLRGEIVIYPYEVYQSSYAMLGDEELETLLSDQPSLLEYAKSNRMPQNPLDGAAALFGGAGAYVPFASGDGLRYITLFAQDWVVFPPDITYEYLYRGITTDGDFFIAAQYFPVSIPPGTLPVEEPREDADYPRYLQQFEANLAAQPTSAFTPDLALLDALFSSLTITDSDALLDLIP